MSFPATYNFSYYRGDTFQFVVRPKNADGSAFDLSPSPDPNYTASFIIATQRGSSGIQYVASAAVDTSANIITCTISPSVGRNLAPGTYVYDVQITNGATSIYTLLTGSVSVTDDIVGAV